MSSQQILSVAAFFRMLLLSNAQTTTPTTSGTSAPASSSTSTAGTTVYPQYFFQYPIPQPNLTIEHALQVSTKDSILVSWTYNGVQRPPVLNIECYFRNISEPFSYFEPLDDQMDPALTTNLTTTQNTTDLSYNLTLDAYALYSPCQLNLIDLDSGDKSRSGVVFLSDNSTAAGQTWSADNRAPESMNPTQRKTGGAGRMRSITGGVWGLMMGVGGAVAVMSLL